jgi:Flp pilus assembly protein TadB
MNLNDPFGRVEQKKQGSYESLRRSLIEAGVTTRAQAEGVMQGMRKRAIVILLLVSLIALISVLFFPSISALVLVLAVIILFWLLVTTLNGFSFVKRYVKDELSE